MTLPAHWTEEQLEEQRLAAIEIFRRRRMEEPLEQYIANFDEYQGVIEELLESTLDLSDIDSRLVDVLTAPKTLIDRAIEARSVGDISHGDIASNRRPGSRGGPPAGRVPELDGCPSPGRDRGRCWGVAMGR